MHDREPTPAERDLVGQLVAAGGIDSVTAAFVLKEIRQFPLELVDEYVNASAWLVLARGQQMAALRKIQETGKCVAPGVASALLLVWGAAASGLAAEKVKGMVPKQEAEAPPAGDGSPPS